MRVCARARCSGERFLGRARHLLRRRYERAGKLHNADLPEPGVIHAQRNRPPGAHFFVWAPPSPLAAEEREIEGELEVIRNGFVFLRALPPGFF